jgi:hypothetical protein
MHRQRKLSLREQIMLKLGLVRYCRCNYCNGGKWKQYHSDKKYVTPNLLRPFDETRYVTRSLWSSVCKGARAVYSS